MYHSVLACFCLFYSYCPSHFCNNYNILKYLAVKQQLEKKKPGTGNGLETSKTPESA